MSISKKQICKIIYAIQSIYDEQEAVELIEHVMINMYTPIALSEQVEEAQKIATDWNKAMVAPLKGILDPNGETREEIARKINDTCKREFETSFDLLDELDRVKLIMSLENHYGIEIFVHDEADYTFREVVESIYTELEEKLCS